MKKRNLIVGSVLAGSILLSAGAAHACKGPGGHQRSDKMMHVMEKLDLSEEQLASISSIKDQQKEQMSASRTEMKNIREALREQANSDNYDAAKVRELADAKAKLIAEITVKRTETMNRIRKELTPEQIAKMDKMKQRRSERHAD